MRALRQPARTAGAPSAAGSTGAAASSLDRTRRRLSVVAELQRARLDAAQDVDHPAVLEPHLVVEEPPQLLGQQADRRLGALAGVQPVVVDVPQPRVGSPVTSASSCTRSSRSVSSSWRAWDSRKS